MEQHSRILKARNMASKYFIPEIEGEKNPILAGLNTAQSIAVTNPAPVVQILAPPGSGKTRTLTSRVAYLLSPAQGLAPQNVIVATFTVKAAREMKDRISKLVGNGIESKLVLGTFHSIARRYLVRYGHLLGLRSGWGIADNGDSIGIVKRILKKKGLPITDAKVVRSRISHFKARNSVPAVNAPAKVVGTQLTQQNTQQEEKGISTQEFVGIFQAYASGLEASNLLDYDDLLLKCLELLKKHPECVGNVEAVLIDEFQDTNLVQFELMRLLASKKNCITIVGDPDQSIYGFRAAEIRNLTRMLRVYPDTLVVHLEQNYRSSASILLAALEVIQQDDSRPQKLLTPTHAVGARPVLRKLPNAEKEAAWIVSEVARIRALSGGVVGLGDVAVLVRSASLTRLIETSFVRAGMAYKMVGGLKFYDRVEIKTLLDYLRVIHNPLNNDAVARIVNVPSRKIGDATIKALLDEADKKGKSLWDVIKSGVSGGWRDLKISKVADNGLGDFVGLVLSTQRLLSQEQVPGDEKTLVDIIEHLLRKLAYEEHLIRHYPEDWEGRWSNITELLTQAQDIVVSDEDEDALPLIDGVPQSDAVATGLQAVLERFLSNTALSEVPEDQEKNAMGQVTISTIHAAKGLEWPVVFIPAVYEGSIPHSRADDTDEERRLLYVAMTRAQGLLYMSCPRRSSSKEKTTPCPFLTPSPLVKLLDKRAPSLRFSLVQSILQILGRTCPSESAINTFVETAGLQSLLDDQIPEKEEWEEREEAAADAEGDWRSRKRRRAEDDEGAVYNLGGQAAAVGWNRGGGNFTGFMTTEQRLKEKMTTAERLAARTTTAERLSAGFKSAGSHMEALKQNRLMCEADKERVDKKARHDAMLATSAATAAAAAEKRAALSAKLAVEKKPAAGPRSNKRAAGQGSLMSYFAPKPPPPKEKEMTATEVMRQARKAGLNLSLKEQMEILPQPKFPVRPPRGEVVILSSPPAKVEDRKRRISPDLEIPSSPVFEEFCRSIEEAAAEAAETTASASVVGSSSSAGFTSAAGFSSRMTAQQGLAGKMTTAEKLAAAAAGPPKKRTLGIRRSMNGWENRASAKKS